MKSGDFVYFSTNYRKKQSPLSTLNAPLLLRNCVLPEQKRCAPDTGDGNQCVDDPAEQGRLAAEEPGHQVELEQRHQAPVQAADDGEDQCDHIHEKYLLLDFGNSMPGNMQVMKKDRR